MSEPVTAWKLSRRRFSREELQLVKVEVVKGPKTVFIPADARALFEHRTLLRLDQVRYTAAAEIEYVRSDLERSIEHARKHLGELEADLATVVRISAEHDQKDAQP